MNGRNPQNKKYRYEYPTRIFKAFTDCIDKQGSERISASDFYENGYSRSGVRFDDSSARCEEDVSKGCTLLVGVVPVLFLTACGFFAGSVKDAKNACCSENEKQESLLTAPPANNTMS